MDEVSTEAHKPGAGRRRRRTMRPEPSATACARGELPVPLAVFTATDPETRCHETAGRLDRHGAVRQLQTGLSQDSEAVLFATQRPRHSARAAARFCLKRGLLERLRSLLKCSVAEARRKRTSEDFASAGTAASPAPVVGTAGARSRPGRSAKPIERSRPFRGRRTCAARQDRSAASEKTAVRRRLSSSGTSQVMSLSGQINRESRLRRAST